TTSFYNLKVAIGSAIIPILQAVLPAIKSVIDGLTVLFNQFARFTAILFGVKLGADAVADAAQGAEGVTDGLTEGLNETEKAAKGALAAFDDLDVLAKKQQPPTAAVPATTPPGLAEGA